MKIFHLKEHFKQFKTASKLLQMNPLEKVPFATFYPLQKYLRGTSFSKKDFFKWTQIY